MKDISYELKSLLIVCILLTITFFIFAFLCKKDKVVFAVLLTLAIVLSIKSIIIGILLAEHLKTARITN